MSKISDRQIIHVTKEGNYRKSDCITVEEPLEIRLRYNGKFGSPSTTSLAVTMRTPGEDEHLSRGFLLTEGIIRDQGDIEDIDYPEENIIQLTLIPSCRFNPAILNRNFYTSSSCGICGKASIDSIITESRFLPWTSKFSVPAKIFEQIFVQLQNSQPTFNQTGGIHAAALFDKTGNLVSLKEDVGRHNAMDKLIGSQDTLPLYEKIVLVSGRASFELVQKAVMAGIPILAAVGAPSSLAIDAAVEHGLTLIGFLKTSSFNIYSCPDRIQF